MPSSSLVLFGCILAIFAQDAIGSVFSGFTIGREFEYIGKFSFDWDKNMSKVIGSISASIHTYSPDLQLAIYDDEQEFWTYIMANHSCDCACKVSKAHTKVVRNVTVAKSSKDVYKFGLKIHEHLRPRFWYVAVAKCVPGGDTYVPAYTQISESNFHKYFFSAWYRVEMLQADGSQFPVHQRGLTVIYAVMAALSGVLMFYQSTAAKVMHHSESFHPIMKLLTTIISLFFADNVLMTLHFLVFGLNGIGLPLCLCIGRIMEVFTRVSMILLAMLIAKGWTINTVTLEGQEKLTMLICIVLSLYLSLAMWYLIWLDPASTLYLYDSWSGMTICVIQLFVVFWFTSTILETRRTEDVSFKRKFFLNMTVLFNLYLISLPIVVFIASQLMPWVREKVVDSVMLSINFVTYSNLCYILWPTRAPKYFERLYSVSTDAEKATLRESQEYCLPSEEL